VEILFETVFELAAFVLTRRQRVLSEGGDRAQVCSGKLLVLTPDFAGKTDKNY